MELFQILKRFFPSGYTSCWPMGMTFSIGCYVIQGKVIRTLGRINMPGQAPHGSFLLWICVEPKRELWWKETSRLTRMQKTFFRTSRLNAKKKSSRNTLLCLKSAIKITSCHHGPVTFFTLCSRLAKSKFQARSFNVISLSNNRLSNPEKCNTRDDKRRTSKVCGNLKK